MTANGKNPHLADDWNRNLHPDEETLSSYLDRELDPAVRANVAAHLVDCADCRTALAELRAVSRLLGDLPAVTMPRSFALTPAMAAQAQPRLLQWLPRLRVLSAVAAVLLVISFTGEALSRYPLASGGAGQARPFLEAQQEAAPARPAAPAAATDAASAQAPAEATGAAGTEPATGAASQRSAAAETAPTETAGRAVPAAVSPTPGDAPRIAAAPASSATQQPYASVSATPAAASEPATGPHEVVVTTATNGPFSSYSDAGWRIAQIITGILALGLLAVTAMASRIASRRRRSQ